MVSVCIRPFFIGNDGHPIKLVQAERPHWFVDLKSHWASLGRAPPSHPQGRRAASSPGSWSSLTAALQEERLPPVPSVPLAVVSRVQHSDRPDQAARGVRGRSSRGVWEILRPTGCRADAHVHVSSAAAASESDRRSRCGPCRPCWEERGSSRWVVLRCRARPRSNRLPRAPGSGSRTEMRGWRPHCGLHVLTWHS